MSNTIKPAAADIHEDRLPAQTPAVSGQSSSLAGLFSLRRARYFNEFNQAVFDKTVCGVRRTNIAEAEGELAHAGVARDRRGRNSTR